MSKLYTKVKIIDYDEFKNYFSDQYYKRRAYINFGWNSFEVSVKDKIENFLETEGKSGVNRIHSRDLKNLKELLVHSAGSHDFLSPLQKYF